MPCESATVPAAVCFLCDFEILFDHCLIAFVIMGRSQNQKQVRRPASDCKFNAFGNKSKVFLYIEAILLLVLMVFALRASIDLSKTNKMIKKCERCNHEFTCKNDNIFECHCIHVPISQKAQKFMSENYNDCLCNKCLREIAAMFSPDLCVLNKQDEIIDLDYTYKKSDNLH